MKGDEVVTGKGPKDYTAYDEDIQKEKSRDQVLKN
jgi:hypothetical protein